MEAFKLQRSSRVTCHALAPRQVALQTFVIAPLSRSPMLTEHFSGADGSGDADEIRSSPGDAGAEEAVLRVGCSSEKDE